MIYFLMQLAAWPIFRLLYRFRVRGFQHVPATGGMVLAANHVSFFDPPMLGAAMLRRPVSFMAKEELFRVPVFGPAIRGLYAVSVRRGQLSRSQLKDFIGLVRREGRALVVFPEGTRSADGVLGVAHRGVGAICRMAEVPVIPVLILGTWSVWPRTRRLPRPWGRIEVRFGAPVEWSHETLSASGDASGALASLIMRRIAALHESEDAPVGFWEGYRLMLTRSSAAGARTNVQPVSQGGGVEHRGKSV